MQTINAKHALTPAGWERDVCVSIDGERIAGVKRGTDPAAGQAVEVLLPAPVNLHSHAFQRAMAGLTERRGSDGRDSFWTWRQAMFRFLDHITPDDVEAITALVQMEMAEAGFGACVEFHYLHHAPGGIPYGDLAEMGGRILAASDATGLGLTLAPVLYQVGGCDGRALGEGQIRFGNSMDRFARLFGDLADRAGWGRDDTRMAVAPHSLRAVTADGLRAIAELAGGAAPVHIHVAEQVAEVEEVEAAFGAHPVDYLLEIARVDARWCLVHCTQADRAQVRRIAETGAVAGLCPITEASLGDGIFEADAFVGAGGRFGIGSDSNIRISLAEELRSLEYSQRLRDRGRAVLGEARRSTGRALFERALEGGALAAGRDCGRLAEGALADLVGLRDTGGRFAGVEGDLLLDSFVFAGGNEDVSDLWSAGRHIVSGGRHRKRDEIEAAYERAAGRLRSLV